jgi:dienelactone hydrolase
MRLLLPPPVVVLVHMCVRVEKHDHVVASRFAAHGLLLRNTE